MTNSNARRVFDRSIRRPPPQVNAAVTDFNSTITAPQPTQDVTNTATAIQRAVGTPWLVISEQSAQTAPSYIPETADWSGIYGFQVTCGETLSKQSRTTTWTYAEDKAKLYVNMNVVCPFRLSVNQLPPLGSFVRIQAVFALPQHSDKVVDRCVTHSMNTDVTNKDQSAPNNHLIRCNHSFAEYIEDPVTKRHSVRVPYKDPEAGMDYTSYYLKFMCLGSCVGGLNRRPIKVVFTLENGNIILGRKSMDVRICACPGRDRASEEKQNETPNNLNKSRNNKCKIKREPGSDVTSKCKKPKTNDENEVFFVKVRGRKNYNTIVEIRDALELKSSLLDHPTKKNPVKLKSLKSSDESTEDET